MLVHDAMTPRPVTLGTSTTLEQAFTTLSSHGVSALPVVDRDGRVLGVVSEADLLPGAYAPDGRAHLIPARAQPAPTAETVAEVMTSPAVTVHARTDVVDVVRLMTEHGFKSLPVVDDDDALVGVVSRSDLVRLHTRSDDAITVDVATLLGDLLHPEWTFSVLHGVVAVSGPLTTRDRALAEASVITVPGVVRVDTDHR